MATFTIQIKAGGIFSKTIKADSLEDALEKAKEIESDAVITARRGWNCDWTDAAEVNGILA